MKDADRTESSELLSVERAPSVRVLLVEDDADDARLIVRRLRTSGLDVTSQRVFDAKSLIDALESSPWDVILADHRLPGFGGPEALRIIAEAGLDVPVIVVSGTVDIATALDALKAGAKDFVFKDDLQRLPSIISRETAQAALRSKERLLEEERDRAVRESRESEARFRVLFETMTEGFSICEIITDDDGAPCDLRYLEVNPAFEQQTGLAAAAIRGKTMLELFPGAEDSWIERYGAVALTGHSNRWEAQFGPLGRWFDCSAYQVDPGRLAVVFFDVTERHESEATARRLAYTDHLTGLANRPLLEDRASLAIARARRTGDSVALLFMDLDRIKSVNDTLGHLAGDDLLRQVGERLMSLFRAEDTVARMGGDEFVAFTRVADSAHAELVADRLVKLMAEPFMVEGQELRTSASVGVAVFPEDGQDLETLIAQADKAMYAAKSAGRNGYAMHGGPSPVA